MVPINGIRLFVKTSYAIHIYRSVCVCGWSLFKYVNAMRSQRMSGQVSEWVNKCGRQNARNPNHLFNAFHSIRLIYNVKVRFLWNGRLFPIIFFSLLFFLRNQDMNTFTSITNILVFFPLAYWVFESQHNNNNWKRHKQNVFHIKRCITFSHKWIVRNCRLVPFLSFSLGDNILNSV